MIELIITIAIVAVAAVFLAYRLLLRLRGKGGCSACGRDCPRR